MAKKVFVSGCFDMLHSGHIAFFEEAAGYGDLYVGIGSDKTIFDLKGKPTVNPEEERKYMIESLKFVKAVWVNRGSGLMDFEEDVRMFRPDIFFVNEDGHNPRKEKLCQELGIQYQVSRRKPHANLVERSTTRLRMSCNIPYRIDLAGGWLDQPYVSRFYPGPVITISIEPDYEFNDRSGMATSTRYKAIELWQNRIPPDEPEKLAYQLFCYENPPGTSYVSGSQDALGIVMPGMNQLYYEEGKYWPGKIDRILNDEILQWVENHIRLIPLEPRLSGFNVTDETRITLPHARDLAEAALQLWDAALNLDAVAFGKAMIRSFHAQVAMFPLMLNDFVLASIEEIKSKCHGYKLSGAGGGGYLVLFTSEELPVGLKIRIRRSLS